MNENYINCLSDENIISGIYAEVALTGTALPVLLNISPAAKFDFGECPVNEHADILCTIKNESNILPALFEFRRYCTNAIFLFEFHYNVIVPFR